MKVRLADGKLVELAKAAATSRCCSAPVEKLGSDHGPGTDKFEVTICVACRAHVERLPGTDWEWVSNDEGQEPSGPPGHSP